MEHTGEFYEKSKSKNKKNDLKFERATRLFPAQRPAEYEGPCTRQNRANIPTSRGANGESHSKYPPIKTVSTQTTASSRYPDPPYERHNEINGE